MKKLMTMLAAVGMAFGLFADEPEPITPISSTSFEVDDNEFDGENLIVNVDGSAWTCEDAEAKLTKGVYNGDAYEYPADKPRYSTFDAQDNFLSVKTAFGKPLERAEAATVTDTAVFFDQLVKFTAADKDTDFDVPNDGKIAFYVQNDAEGDDDPAVNNLYVIAGQYDNNVLSVVTNNLGEINVDAWHRLTIKAMKGYAGDALAFEVFLDGVALKLAAPAIDKASTAGMTDTAKAVNSARKLFPSCVEGTLALAGLALAGQGAIDDVIVTTEVPGTWAEDKNVLIAWDDNVREFTYTYGGVSDTMNVSGAGSFPIAYSGSFDVTISNVNCAENWGFDTVTCDGGCSYDAGVISFTGENQTATITSKDTTPRIKIGENTYATFAEAIKAIGDVPAGQTVTVELQDDVPASWDEEEGTEATFDAGEGEIIIDLAGNTISGTAEDGTYVVKCIGNVTIMDSVGTGAIAVSENYIGAVRESSGCLKITGGTFEGAVKIDEGDDASIFGGKFDKETNGGDEFTLKDYVDDSCDLGDDGTYFVVTPAKMWTVTFYDGEDVLDTKQVKDGETVKPIENPTKDYYEFEKWQKDGIDFDFTTAITADTKLDAVWTAVEFTVQYFDEGVEEGEALKTNTFTVADYENLVLWDGTREGFVFDGTWTEYATGDYNTIETDEDLRNLIAGLVTAEAEDLSVEIYGTWTEAPTDVTITLPEPLPAGVDSLVVSQKVDEVWVEVIDEGEGLKIGVGNEYVVNANPAAGYKVENPIVSDTAEAGEDITVTAEEVAAKVKQIDYVAQVTSADGQTTTQYESLKEAAAAAQAGDTVAVLKAHSFSEPFYFYNKGTNDADTINFVNDYEIKAKTGYYAMYIVGSKVNWTGAGTFVKESGSASVILVGSCKKPNQEDRPATCDNGYLTFAGNLKGGTNDTYVADYSDAPSNLIKCEGGFCRFNGGTLVNTRTESTNGRCVCASGENGYTGVVEVVTCDFIANDPLKAENNGIMKFVGDSSSNARVKQNMGKPLDYGKYCALGQTFVYNEEGKDAGWYTVGLYTFNIVVTDGAEAQGTADPASFTTETFTNPFEVTLTKPTAPQGKVFDSWSANYGEIIGETLTLTELPVKNESVVVTVVWKDAPAEDDPTNIDPKDIPEGKTVGELFKKVPADLAAADAKAFATWCQGKAIAGGSTVGEAGAAAKLDAFLLDCGNSDAEIAEAQKNFKVTGIAQNADGEWEITPKTGAPYGNGEVTVKSYEDVGCTKEDEDGSFFKLSLGLPK